MRVILLKNHKSLGRTGELKEVSEGYARNYLIPQKIAKVADEKSITDFKLQVKQKQKKQQQYLQKKEEFIKNLDRQQINITRPANESGVLFAQVKSVDVLNELKKLNFFWDDIKVADCHLKNIGEHWVKILFSDQSSLAIKINILKQP